MSDQNNVSSKSWKIIFFSMKNEKKSSLFDSEIFPQNVRDFFRFCDFVFKIFVIFRLFSKMSSFFFQIFWFFNFVWDFQISDFYWNFQIFPKISRFFRFLIFQKFQICQSNKFKYRGNMFKKIEEIRLRILIISYDQ